MKNRGWVVLALFGALVGFGCGDSGGGDLTNEAGLAGVMQSIALDFAGVLVDVAPDNSILAVKGLAASTADCPEGGSATWSESNGPGAGGTLALSGCTMRGVNVTGSLAGFLFQEFGNLSANGLTGQLVLSGAASGDLNVQRLDVSASVPIADESTFWQIDVIADDGDLLCAWSGGGPCPAFF